jgi:putative acetyltransferase
MSASLRPGRDSDAQGLIALIGGVFSEYPGCVLELDGEMPELRRIASYFAEHDGRFWVAEREGEIVGCIGLTPASDPRGIELKKLYVRSTERKSGLGGRLVALVEAAAHERGAAFIDLWSDTRFTTAHAFYEKRGWVRGPNTRELHDLSQTVEYYFSKPLTR